MWYTFASFSQCDWLIHRLFCSDFRDQSIDYSNVSIVLDMNNFIDKYETTYKQYRGQNERLSSRKILLGILKI